MESIGSELNFKYGDIEGVLKILSRLKDSDSVFVYIEGYTDECGKQINISKLKDCKLGAFFKKPIAITHPELVKYFYNKEDAYKYTHGSSKKVQMICPFCGTIKYQSIYQLVSQGFGCTVCSDGISYPNKFIFNLLTQLGVNFKNEISKSTPGFEWVENYKYDFYFEQNNKKYFIEADGGFHRYKDVQLRDKIKDSMAREHNINMIRIDCDYGRMSMRYNFIKKQILNSKLSLLFDVSNIDWEIINRKAIESYIIIASEYWNKNYKICDIAKELHISEQTITSYLKIAAEIGLCDYNKEKSEERRKSVMANFIKTTRSKPIALYKDNIPIGCFLNANELSQQSLELYGVYLHGPSIREICRGEKKHTKGYTARYISYEEYEQFKTIQNECSNLQEVV